MPLEKSIIKGESCTLWNNSEGYLVGCLVHPGQALRQRRSILGCHPVFQSLCCTLSQHLDTLHVLLLKSPRLSLVNFVQTWMRREMHPQNMPRSLSLILETALWSGCGVDKSTANCLSGQVTVQRQDRSRMQCGVTPPVWHQNSPKHYFYYYCSFQGRHRGLPELHHRATGHLQA